VTGIVSLFAEFVKKFSLVVSIAMIEALQYGTPPHGGIALGLDRIVMILAGADSLREVIPFPKTAKAIDLMMEPPTPVSDKQLKELGIAVVPKRD